MSDARAPSRNAATEDSPALARRVAAATNPVRGAA